MSTNANISARIKELQTAVAKHVVHAGASKRSWRIGVLQQIIDRTLATIEARSVMYANHMGESQRLRAQDLRAEKAAIDSGFFEVDNIGNPVAGAWEDLPQANVSPRVRSQNRVALLARLSKVSRLPARSAAAAK